MVAEKLGKSKKVKINDYNCIISTPMAKSNFMMIDIPFYFKLDEPFNKASTLDGMAELNTQIRRFKTHLYNYLNKSVREVFAAVKSNKRDHIKDLITAEIFGTSALKFSKSYTYARFEISLWLNEELTMDDVYWESSMLIEYITQWLNNQDMITVIPTKKPAN